MNKLNFRKQFLKIHCMFAVYVLRHLGWKINAATEFNRIFVSKYSLNKIYV